MRLPEFTAEASLGKTTRHYQGRSLRQPNKAIHPTSADWPGGWEWDQAGPGDLDFGFPRTYGTVNPGKVGAFGACITKCMAGAAGATYGVCRGSCCQQLTGHYACVVP